MNLSIKLEKNRGITLIALVVAIILLLILAGVSINMLTGQNGILENTQTAKITSELSNYKEQVDLYKTQKMIENTNFNENSLTAGKNKLVYNTQNDNEIGNIQTIIPNISKEYKEIIEVVKGKMVINTKDKKVIKIAQSLELEANPYTIENGELKSSKENLLLMDNEGTLTIPDSVEKIGNGAFKELNGLKTIIIPGTCKEIGDYAFADNKTLEKVVIEKGVSNIGSFSFQGCTALKEIKLPEGLTSIGKSCFQSCVSLTSINIPHGVEYMTSRILSNCKNITEIVIPESVKSIEWCAFEYCNRINSIYVPASVNNIATGAFSCMDNLEKVDIDEKNQNYIYKDKMILTIDGKNLVNVLSNATTLNIPNTVEVVMKEALTTCNLLTEITIPKSLTDIQGSLPSNLHMITVEAGNTKYKSVNGNLYDSDVKTLYKYVTNDKEVILPDSVEILKTRCFYGQNNVEKLILPDSLKCIESIVFQGTKITELDIPATVNSISPQTFKDVDVNINIQAENETYKSVDGIYVLSKDGTEIYSISQNLKEYKIPDTVEKIKRYSFYAKDQLKDIYIGNNVKIIEDYAFDYCYNMQTMTISSSVKEIYPEAFSRCDKLSHIQINNVKDSIKNAPWGAPYGLRAVEWNG